MTWFSAGSTARASGAAPKANTFEPVEKVTAVDAHTVRITFKKAKPYPYDVFGGSTTPILQRAQFKGCLGDKAPTCGAQNFGPIGTGPFTVKDFRPTTWCRWSPTPTTATPTSPPSPP